MITCCLHHWYGSGKPLCAAYPGNQNKSIQRNCTGWPCKIVLLQGHRPNRHHHIHAHSTGNTGISLSTKHHGTRQTTHQTNNEGMHIFRLSLTVSLIVLHSFLSPPAVTLPFSEWLQSNLHLCSVKRYSMVRHSSSCSCIGAAFH